ncbi:hypothetical protein HK107_03335 [Parvularcula sp. ZS-1/3]|uniref:VPLPA-CTERM sorting domain-containing protein n=1 Tax=Parvularcula mediterranea TaxID=2732508 RepID=A0A7Y3RJQ3_9PROT|nr:hypothetical protein [Parvularcula mediterranea]NNU15359.1 hypothetical protein [Parvularcula mediterranea]
MSAAAAAATLMASAHAAPFVIDFEGAPEGTQLIAPNAGLLPNVATITVSNANGPNALIIFDTTENSDDSNDPDLVDNQSGVFTGFDDPSTAAVEQATFGNIAVIADQMPFNPADDEGSGGTVLFELETVSTLFSLDLLDSKSGTVEFFDENGDEIAGSMVTLPNVDTTDANFPNLAATVLFNGVSGISGVKSFRITLGESGGFDNIVGQAVPIPGALPLFVAGLGGFAAMRRRRAAK